MAATAGTIPTRPIATANEQHRAVLPAESFDPYTTLVLDLESRDDVASLLIVRAEGEPIGTVTFFADAAAERWGGTTGVSGLRAMAVEPARRRDGIGAALVAPATPARERSRSTRPSGCATRSGSTSGVASSASPNATVARVS